MPMPRSRTLGSLLSEISERCPADEAVVAGLAALFVCLLAKEMKSVEHVLPAAIRIQLDVISHGVGGKESIYAACLDQVLLNDEIQKRVALRVDLACLRATVSFLNDTRVNSLQAPGVEKRRPVDELA